MWRIALAAVACAMGASGQEGFGATIFSRAPKHVDDALRERVSLFYDSQMKGKSRQADAAVHEDSKDIFFEAEKLKMRGFKVVGITYEENFLRAKVVIDIDTEFHFVGFETMRINRPVASTWKFDQGQWWWHVEKSATQVTAFGPMKAGPEGGDVKADISKFIQTNQVTPDQLRNKVRVDKTTVELSSHEQSSAEITIKNGFEGPVEISMQADDFPGVGFNLETTKVESGQSTRLLISHRPVGAAKKPDLRVMLFVDPIGKQIPITVTFAYPPFTEPKPGERVAVKPTPPAPKDEKKQDGKK